MNEQTLLKTAAGLDLCHLCAIFFVGWNGKETAVLECLAGVPRAFTRY